jgi:hypothetical protein
LKGLGNIGGLRGLVPASQHHNQHGFALSVIHPPSRAKVLKHFKYAGAHRLDISEIPALCFVEAPAQPKACGAVLDAVKPIFNSGVILTVIMA